MIDKNTPFTDDHFRFREFGLTVTKPLSIANLIPPPTLKSTQAEVRRDKLLWKLKRRIALRNWCLFILCYLVVALGLSFFVLIGTVWLDNYVGSQAGVLGGLFLCYTLILPWIIIGTWFERNPNFIYPKR